MNNHPSETQRTSNSNQEGTEKQQQQQGQPQEHYQYNQNRYNQNSFNNNNRDSGYMNSRESGGYKNSYNNNNNTRDGGYTRDKNSYNNNYNNNRQGGYKNQNNNNQINYREKEQNEDTIQDDINAKTSNNPQAEVDIPSRDVQRDRNQNNNNNNRKEGNYNRDNQNYKNQNNNNPNREEGYYNTRGNNINIPNKGGVYDGPKRSTKPDSGNNPAETIKEQNEGDHAKSNDFPELNSSIATNNNSSVAEQVKKEEQSNLGAGDQGYKSRNQRGQNNNNYNDNNSHNGRDNKRDYQKNSSNNNNNNQNNRRFESGNTAPADNRRVQNVFIESNEDFPDLLMAGNLPDNNNKKPKGKLPVQSKDHSSIADVEDKHISKITENQEVVVVVKEDIKQQKQEADGYDQDEGLYVNPNRREQTNQGNNNNNNHGKYNDRNNQDYRRDDRRNNNNNNQQKRREDRRNNNNNQREEEQLREDEGDNSSNQREDQQEHVDNRDNDVPNQNRRENNRNFNKNQQRNSNNESDNQGNRASNNQGGFQNKSQQGYAKSTQVIYIEKEATRKFQFFNSKSKVGEAGDNANEDIDEQQKNTKTNEDDCQSNNKTAQELTNVQQPSVLSQPLTQNLNHGAPHKILVRSKEGIFSSSSYATKVDYNACVFPGPSEFMCLSKDEQFILLSSDTTVSVVNVHTHEIESSREFISIKHCALSANNKFIQVFDRVDNSKYLAGLFTFPQFQLIREFNEKRYIKENAPYLKFNSDETKAYYYNYSTGNIEVYSTEGKLETPLKLAEMSNIDFFQISPKHEYITGCFLEHMVGYDRTQAKLQFYNLEKDRREKVKNVDKAQEITMKWSPDGTNVIIVTQAIHDTTGSTYYGQTALWLYSFGFKKMLQIPTLDGPVHDVAWHPNGETFIIIVGYMPAKPVLYTVRGDPIFSFGSMHRNTIRYQPQGQLVLFGGFGNISGDVDIWELNSLERVAKFNSATSVYIEWSLDGKYILTGVLTPRLRVDNNYKLFKWNGDLVNTCGFQTTELYEVAWKQNQVYSDKTAISEQEIADMIAKQRKATRQANLTQEPKFGGGNFAALLRNDRTDEGPMKITGNEEWLIKARNEAKKVKKQEE